MDKLTALYQSVILTHNNTPQHFEKRLAAQHVIEAYNPLCGDKFKLFLDIENGRISHATFHGYGCAISKAATSVLLTKIQGKTVEGVLHDIDTYFNVLDSRNAENSLENTAPTEGGVLDESVNAFKAVQAFPERRTCAVLSWQAAKDFLETIV
jgi:nitrogen fixation protein NifU and related proteins